MLIYIAQAAMAMKAVLLSNHTPLVYTTQQPPRLEWLFGVLNREPGAAFGAAALQYSAATLARNAGSEAVRAGAVAFMWLVCSLWHITGNYTTGGQ